MTAGAAIANARAESDEEPGNEQKRRGSGLCPCGTRKELQRDGARDHHYGHECDAPATIARRAPLRAFASAAPATLAAPPSHEAFDDAADACDAPDRPEQQRRREADQRAACQ